MKRTSAVIFPDTVPGEQAVIPLVPVFEQVVYCQPVENDDSGEPLSPICTELLEQGAFAFHAPAPLGKDRERFLRLVKDLRQRRDDYAAQLAHVSLAGMAAGNQPGLESKSSILANLLAGHGIDSTNRELEEKLLWQARLVLKLGEQYDADQRKVVMDMQHIHEREQKLFSGLSSESGNLFSLTGKLAAPAAETGRLQRLRLKAWSRLYAFGTAAVPGSFFVATDPDAIDRLCEEYERRSGSRPLSFLALPLPCRNTYGKESLDLYRRFLRNESETCDILTGLLHDPSAWSSEFQEMWDTALERHFPRQDFDRCQLVLYALAGVRKKQFFLDSFGHDEDAMESGIAGEPEENIVVGLLV